MLRRFEERNERPALDGKQQMRPDERPLKHRVAIRREFRTPRLVVHEHQFQFDERLDAKRMDRYTRGIDSRHSIGYRT